MKGRAVMILVCIFLSVGCTNHTRDIERVKVELTFSTFLTEEQFEQEIKEPLKEQFPNIELIRLDDSGKGVFSLHHGADIHHEMLGGKMYFNDSSYESSFPAIDLTDLIAESGFRTETIPQPLWNHVRAISSNGEVEGLPYIRKLYGLFVHEGFSGKDAASQGNVTWDTVANMNAALPPTDKGRWLRYWLVFEMMNQLSIPLVQAEHDREELRSKFSKIARAVAQFKAGSAGITFSQEDLLNGDSGALENIQTFVPSGTATLYAQARRNYSEIEHLLGKPEYDVANFPYFSEDEPVVPARVQEILQIGENSSYKYEAFEIIAYMVSEPFQLKNARIGLGPVLDDIRIYEQFGQDVPAFEGKNIAAFFQPGLAEYPINANMLVQPLVEQAEVKIFNIVDSQLKGEIDEEEATRLYMEVYAPFVR
ncbi:hypothetical protein DUZ99_06765 [Xylanibacillus composti]|uniref:Carbohydrate ABC transporter substrate-binding protein n=1 Tax=Xylanibacillus composti TaxID=1572762 RepID=A0A8J4H531_9BACL|nr:hypothetical protein [Xylanibacillus composti]MDT9724694.1 hypothetical protein [Xylanibacillus composti]GIQ70979.1 hypothetical protein XYCOK13_38030 [Xylanibacillus composti]